MTQQTITGTKFKSILVNRSEQTVCSIQSSTGSWLRVDNVSNETQDGFDVWQRNQYPDEDMVRYVANSDTHTVDIADISDMVAR